MPPTRKPKATNQISVTLPIVALEMVEELQAVGLYGTTRAEVARTLILARLEDVIAKGILRRRDG